MPPVTPVIVPADPTQNPNKLLADALDMAVQSFGEYFKYKVDGALAHIVRTEVAQAMQRTLAGQMELDIKDILRKEVQRQVDLLRSQIKVGVTLSE